MSELDQSDNPPTAPEAETKRQRFVRLANFRVGKVLERIQQLDHLANTSQYEFTIEDVTKMRSAIDEQIEATFRKFFGKKEKKEFSIE